MSDLKIGDMVVLTSGSMRMAVEGVDDETVRVVWCHEGVIGRDAFDARLLRKWEDRGGDSDAGQSRGKPFRGDREGGGREMRGNDRGGDRGGDKPRGKPGWDGKPREKKFFRKD